MEEMSNEVRKQLLQTALIAEYGMAQKSPIPKNIQIEEVFDSEIAYSVDGQHYKMPYTMENDKAVFGEPEKVVKKTTYKAMESVRETYSEIIQEAGKRNAALDSTRLSKIMALLTELMDREEEPDAKEAKEALKEAKNVLTWLKEQAATKTEDGESFPAAAYAYVPDSEKTTTWKLRLWEDLEKKVTRAQLGRAAAALGPGGFRGQRVQIPSADLAAVKRKIRAEYRRLGVESEDMPRALRESWAETQKGTVWTKMDEARDYIRESIEIPIEEVTVDNLAKGILPVRFLSPGFNAGKSRYYTEAAIADAPKVFDGVQMFANHQTESEAKERPEGDIRDWVAVLEDTKVSAKGNAVGTARIHASWFKEMVNGLFQQGTLDKLGTSINAIGKGVKETIDGIKTLTVEEITGGRSVDFVTLAGAGGVAGLQESALIESQAGAEYDVDLVTLETLRERRPDLVKNIEAEIKSQILQEGKKTMELEDQIKEKDTQIETLTKERDGLQGKITEAEKAQKTAEAKSAIDKAVGESELPEPSKARLLEGFTDAESADGVTDAIKAEAEYITALAETGKVVGLGSTTTDPEKDHKALVESFKNMGMSDNEAETAAKGR